MLIDKIEEVINRWNNQRCPHCGADVEIDGNYDFGTWYPGNEDCAFSYCTHCDFKHYLLCDEPFIPDDCYLNEIERIVKFHRTSWRNYANELDNKKT